MSTPAPGHSFPGQVLRKDQDNNAQDVLALQRRLNERGCGPVPETGVFDSKTFNSVKLFQSRSTDAQGIPLVTDGKVGPLTWAVLFAAQPLPVIAAASPLLQKVLEAAQRQVGVMEAPPGSNRGPQVDRYLRSVGLDPAAGSFAWCVAFIYFCFEEAATELGRDNPMIRTAGVLDHWRKAAQRGIPRITSQSAANQPELVKPGHIFVIDTGGGLGHSGLVAGRNGGKIVTIEGNSNEDGSRNGVGVFRRTARTFAGINRGFVDYGSV